jgi:tetratricopeptide (TPR) repeat protein
MKELTIVFLTFLSLTVFGQTETETIKKANDLITNKKYESAFKLLDNFDPENSKPDIVLLKVDIVLNYFVTSLMHQGFALKDLEKNENIVDYRGREGSFGLQMFQVDSILGKLIEIYPTNCKLYKGLGEFYYEVHLKYGDNWLKNDNELFELIQTNFQKAVDGNCADYLSNYVLGYLNIAQDKYQECIPYFLKAIEQNKGYATSHYNLAYAYLFADDRENALKYAKNALNLYTDREYKSDAARMLGVIYTELEDEKNAIESYELADKIDPKNYYTLKPLLELYVKANNKKSDKTAKVFFNLAPANPTIYNDFSEIYYSNKKEDKLIVFYKSQFSAFKDNEKVQGNLNFYLGRIYVEKDKKIAKEYFLKSKEIFGKIFDKDHQVFNAIEEGLEQCEN